MTEPLGGGVADVPPENRYELVFYAEGVVDRSNETEQEDETEESR